jgi:hypothetical protein
MTSLLLLLVVSVFILLPSSAATRHLPTNHVHRSTASSLGQQESHGGLRRRIHETSEPAQAEAVRNEGDDALEETTSSPLLMENPSSDDETIREEAVPTFFSMESNDATNNNNNQSSNGFPFFSVLSAILLSMAALLVVIVALVLYRKHEIQRWNEYRTHQLLAAQEEAFDISCFAEDYDDELELSPRRVT